MRRIGRAGHDARGKALERKDFVHHAEPGSAGSDALALLGSLTATARQEI